MSKPRKYTGFLTYVPGGEITDCLLHDYSFLARKILAGWPVLDCDPDDFVSSCVEKLYRRIQYFDPSLGKIETFLYNVILNECRRLWSMQKTHYASELDVERWESLVWDDSLVQSVNVFCSFAFSRGLYVNAFLLYDALVCGQVSPLVDLFLWWRSRGEL